MGDTATDQRVSDASPELTDLREHWGSAYVIAGVLGHWTAARRDGQGMLRADDPESLRAMIRLDYQANPIPRPDRTRHAVTPMESTVYSWKSLPSSGDIPDDYPLAAVCAGCQKPIDRRTPDSPWQHRVISQLP